MQTTPSFDAPPHDQLTTPTVSRSFVVAVMIGAAVSIALGTYGRVHTPTGQGIATFGFPAVLPMKAWFTTGAAALVIVQITSALWLYGRLPGVGSAPKLVGPVHRWSGTVAFLLTLPVAYHCLWALGFQDTDTRVLAHSLLGCAFYGVFTTKMLILRSERVADWALPVVGAALATVLVALWTTSSLWFFQNFGFPGV
jgi:hypothetical protein